MKWSYILFLPAGVSILWALATVLAKRQLTRAQLLLSLTLLIEGVSMMLLAIFFRGRAGSLFIYDFLLETLVMLCPAMYYIGICSLTEPRGATLRQRRVFFLPLFFILGLTLGAFLLGPRRYELLCHAIRNGEASFRAGDCAWNFMLFWDHWLFPAMMMVLGVVLVILSSRKISLYQRRFNSYYAAGISAPPIDTRWLTVLSWCFAPLGVVAVVAVDFRPYYYKYWLILVSLLLAVLQHLSGRFSYRLDYDARFLAEYVRGGVEKSKSQRV